MAGRDPTASRFDIQTQAAGGRVYLASSLGTGPGGGILLALNAATGARLWSFATMTGTRSAKDGAGGAWEPPLVGAGGTVTFGTGNPYQAPAAGIAHPAPLLYADSAVTLDAATGALRWYYQAVPDDFLDRDLQASPVAATTGTTGVIIAAGKMGEVYAISARTGALVWKTPIGVHNGTDSDPALALARKLHLSAPFTVEPGELGGVQSNLAVAAGRVYVVTNNLAFTYTSLSQVLAAKTASALTGQIEALSLATDQVEWDTRVPALPLGAATVSGSLVFTTLYTGELLAPNRSTGKVVYRRQLPTSTNAPLDVFGNTVLVAAGGAPAGQHDGHAQLIAYTVP